MKPRWFNRKFVRIIAALLLAGFVGLNLVAFMHARAMSRFTLAGERTLSPEKLSFAQKLEVLLTGVKLPKPLNTRTPSAVGLEFETLTFAGARGQTLEAWRVRRAESKGVVVLFHGYGANKSALLEPAKAFHELGYETLLVDFYGSGGSSGRETSIGWHEAEDVQAAFTQAKSLATNAPIILYGPSMGAVAILRAIHTRGIQPAAIIIECPFDRLLATSSNRFRAMRLPAFPLAHLLVFWGGVQQSYNGFAHNPAEYARAVPCPTLLLHGGQDKRVTVPQVLHLFTNLSGAKSLHLFNELGHESYVTARPSEWLETVTTFLEAHLKLATTKPTQR